MHERSLADRIKQMDWAELGSQLNEHGYGTTEALLSPQECGEIVALYDLKHRFRSRIDMARLRFGVGEYKYFSNPLPPIVAALRAALYPQAATIANNWMEMLGLKIRFPPALGQFIDYCHRYGQDKPTPLMLRYEAGGYNCLHQDLYGAVVFPLQFTIMLSRPQHDFEGGEFLLVEQRPRAQSRGAAIVLRQGQAILFPTSQRPQRGLRGYYRLNVRHGVSPIRRGRRLTLGIIFHDAK
jgi:hypothetical protein